MSTFQGFNGSVYQASGTPVAMTNEAMTDSGDHQTWAVTNPAKRYFDPNTVPTFNKISNDVQTISISGSPTGGTFTLTFGANTTVAIAYNAAAATVQTALQNLASIGAGNAIVTGGPGPGTPWVVTFVAAKGGASQSVMTHTDSLTGGSSPAVSIAHTTTGGAASLVSSALYTVQGCGGKLVFNAAQGQYDVYQVATGNYLPISQVAQAKAWDATLETTMVNATVFGSAWKTQQPFQNDWNAKVELLWADQSWLTQLTGQSLVVLQLYVDATKRYEGFAYLKTDNPKAQTTDLLQESLSFVGQTALYYVPA